MGAPFAAGGPPVGAPSVPFCAARLACFSAFALFLSSAGESFSSSAGLGASFAGSDIVSESVRGLFVWLCFVLRPVVRSYMVEFRSGSAYAVVQDIVSQYRWSVFLCA